MNKKMLDKKNKEMALRKSGPPEYMTVAILKEVLTELNITYKSSDRKAALILKVKEARSQMNQHGCNSKKQHHGHHTRNAKRNSGQCHFVLYFDQYAHKRMLILILIMFLLSLYVIPYQHIL